MKMNPIKRAPLLVLMLAACDGGSHLLLDSSLPDSSVADGSLVDGQVPDAAVADGQVPDAAVACVDPARAICSTDNGVRTCTLGDDSDHDATRYLGSYSCGGRTVRCQSGAWVEVTHSDPGQYCPTNGANVPGPACPSAAPEAGSACTLNGAQCLFGRGFVASGSDLVLCGTWLRCESEVWRPRYEDQHGNAAVCGQD